MIPLYSGITAASWIDLVWQDQSTSLLADGEVLSLLEKGLGCTLA
jgi:hypothetical protein